MNVRQFLFEIRQFSLPNVFNPYRDVCSQHDQHESPAIRRSNLKNYLNAAIACGVDSIWLGRDCGYRGARRTGIALTDEAHFDALSNYFSVDRIKKATVSHDIRERTATEIWKMVSRIDKKIFLWNVFPFHPFEEGKPMSNRPHTVKEFNQCKNILQCVMLLLRPNNIVALGADAYYATRRLGLTASRVRHPSYGGHIKFSSDILRLYSADTSTQNSHYNATCGVISKQTNQ